MRHHQLILMDVIPRQNHYRNLVPRVLSYLPYG